MTVQHHLSFALATCLLAATPAAADKPRSKRAIAVARDFLEGLRSERGEAASAYVGRRLEVILQKDGPDDRKCDGRADAAKIGPLLACLAGADLPTLDLEPWTRKSRARLTGPLAAEKARFARLERKLTLVTHHERCVGEGSDLVLAVSLEGKRPRVVGVHAQSYVCGE